MPSRACSGRNTMNTISTYRSAVSVMSGTRLPILLTHRVVNSVECRSSIGRMNSATPTRHTPAQR